MPTLTFYETLSLKVSILAVVIAAASLLRTRKIASQQMELERVTAELSAKQLEILHSEEEERFKARIDVELEGHGSDYHFRITNLGGAEARNVTFKIKGEGDPIIRSEYDDKIPIPSLKPGKSVKLMAAIAMGNSLKYNTVISWQNPDDSVERDDFFLTI